MKIRQQSPVQIDHSSQLGQCLGCWGSYRAVGSGQVDRRHCSGDSGQGTVDIGKCTVDSGQWNMHSGQWTGAVDCGHGDSGQ